MRLVVAVAVATGMVAAPRATAADPKLDPAQVEFFERQVRPLFVEKCQECHGPDKQKGGLRLDSRDALLTGGDSGPALVSGDPSKSRLVQAIGYAGELRMPPKQKLADEHVSTLTKWVKMGAPWPDAAGARAATTGSNLQVTDKDRAFWSFQPVRDYPRPAVRDTDWAQSSIDHFVL